MDRRSTRTRKVSERMAVVDELERRQALAKRLEALEEDTHREEDFAAGSDDEEFVLRESDGDGKKRKKKGGALRVDGGMRKTRGMLEARARGPRTFRDWLEEAELDRLPPDEPSYLTAGVGPPRTAAPRKFCSVCGDFSGYTCTRCGSRYCTLRCQTVHSETRCLKFMA
eukprot:scaffold10.g2483.t1